MELFDRDLVVTDVRIAIFVPPGGAKRVHSNRPSHGFAYCVGCTTTYHFDTGKSFVCHPGQCIYLPRGSNYVVDNHYDENTPGNTGTYAINFRTLDTKTCFEPFLINVRGKDKVLSCFEKAEIAWRKKRVGFREECFCSLYTLIQLFKRELSSYSHLDRILQKLAPALQYIEANYTSETISLPQLAQLCSISEPHLRKLFNAAFSVSPAIYIRNLRLSYAKELLNTGEYSITSVATLSGFNSTIYFSREFKKATGMTPMQYAQNNQ